MTTILHQDILTALRRADIEAPVKQLYHQFFDDVVTQICTNGGNYDDGADIFQESVLVLIDKVKTNKFRGDSSIKTFLSAIARNLWLNELRTRSRRNVREELYMSAADKTAEPVLPLFNKKNTQTLQDILQQVGDTCKKILTGVYYEDKSMKDLLVEFEYENEQVLRNRKSKCMKKLKDLLSGNSGLLNNITQLSLYE